MGAAEMRSAEGSAPAATRTAAAATTASASSAAFTAASTAAAAALRKRDICCAKRPGKCNPERAETCGKSQDDKLFANRTHDRFFP
ncbi:MAG: hypothetical protein ACM3PO_00225 [Betaproteobacteria bacterium]